MNIEILDKHFIALPAKKKMFLVGIGLCYLLVGVVSYLTGLTGIVSSFLIAVVGVLYVEMIKLNYRITDLEKKKK